MSETLLRTVGIHKHFGGVHALKGVDLEIKKGEIHCLAGENGCGKSTLIKIISGFYQPDAGEIYIEGEKREKLSPADSIAAGIQVIYQDFSLFPNLTVMENLSLNSELMNHKKIVNKKRMRDIAQTAVDRIGFKVDFDERVENLTVADKQLVAISRALLFDAKLIIMDEPTSALTRREVRSLFNVIHQLKEEGIAILFVSHKLDEVFEISERFTIMRNGENVFSSTTDELTEKSFTKYLTGRDVENMQLDKSHTVGNVVLETKNLGHEGMFADVNFKTYEGEVLCITGLLGCGRTDLAESLFGILPATEGEIYLSGEKVEIKSVQDAIEAGIGYLPEDRLTQGLFLQRSIKDNLSVAKLDQFAKGGMILDDDAIEKEVDDWIDTLSIATNDKFKPVQTLSGGNQQKVVLARWLALNLKLLILNGPTAGVDIGAKYDIHRFVRRLAAEGLSVLVISDDMPEIMAVSDRVIIMRNGRLAEELNIEDTDAQDLAKRVVQDN